MDNLAQQYDIRITDVVQGEAVERTSSGNLVIDNATGQPYPKDVAVDAWLTQNNVTPTATSVVTGDNAGERSIIEAIQNDPDLYDGTTNTPKAGTFEIASNDVSFFNSNNPDGADYVSSTKGAQQLTREGAVNGTVSLEDYKGLSTDGSSSLTNWDDYKNVTVDAVQNQYDLNGNIDANGDFTFDKGGKSITIS